MPQASKAPPDGQRVALRRCCVEDDGAARGRGCTGRRCSGAACSYENRRRHVSWDDVEHGIGRVCDALTALEEAQRKAWRAWGVHVGLMRVR